MQVKTELWELIGPYWKLPLRVVWVSEQLAEVRVGAGVTLLPKQIAAADELLSSFSQPVGRKWFVSRVLLCRYAIHSTQDDPQDIVEWVPIKKRTVVEADFGGAQEFIKGYCGSEFAVHKDPLIADAVWQSFCRWMFHSLLNLRREVDLFFIRLVPLHYRRNWTSVLATKEAELLKKHKITHHQYLNPELKMILGRGIIDMLADHYLTAYDSKNGVFRTTVEAIPTKHWDELSIRLEVSRREANNFGGNGRRYSTQVRRIIRDHIPKAIEVYAHFLKEARFKAGIFSSSFVDSSFHKLKPDLTDAPVAEAGPVLAHDMPSCAGLEESEQALGTAEVEKLLEMPDLQSEIKELRDEREKVPRHRGGRRRIPGGPSLRGKQPQHPGGGFIKGGKAPIPQASGVPVLDAVQGSV